MLMIKTHTAARFLIAVLPLALSACSTIKSYFPDKEKDYQFTTEIPVLILPPDLDTKAAPAVPSTPSTSDTVAKVVEEAAEVVESVINPKEIKAELVKFDNGEARLRVNASMTRAWREVGRALSHRSLEITYRNQEEGLFRVRYNPDEQPFEDGTLWDEVVFLFSGIGSDAPEYTLKLAENKEQTEVAVLDQNRQTLSEGAGLSLLMLLQETINAKQAD